MNSHAEMSGHGEGNSYTAIETHVAGRSLVDAAQAALSEAPERPLAFVCPPYRERTDGGGAAFTVEADVALAQTLCLELRDLGWATRRAR
jgi:hypothetical protein